MTERNAGARRLIGWTPYAIAGQGREELVRWIDLGDKTFAEPFFEETIQRALDTPGMRLIVTPTVVLSDFPRAVPCLAPSGFIFHMGRVGSTLLANALKAAGDTLVIAEAPPISQLLASPTRRDATARWATSFAGLIAALGQPGGPNQRHYVVKFSSHNVLALSAIRRVFPAVPWLFLTRHPLEVMVSALDNPPGWLGMQRRPQVAAQLLGLPAPDIAQQPPEIYCANVLAAFMRTVLDSGLIQGAVVDHSQLEPGAMAGIARHFGLERSEDQLLRMSTAFRVHSKRPGDGRFSPDTEIKRRTAPPALAALCEARLGALYRRLEAVRLML